ncbi:hypothetical protein M011DRAFT_403600 [Sporormia fimetaria CBS 119925]|uniref:Phospholipid metabolism enzyme regulator n=1 Tax=Sporormia fimetaria CBS 119925 TaxID=1340428 RepID=A0A6A6VCG2_9PLEO|nr:hypothetical protein M011DRAFT_403600 [Sporormia fimetaria CBS 119925]
MASPSETSTSNKRPSRSVAAAEAGLPTPRRHKALSGNSRSRTVSGSNSPMSSRDTSPSRQSHRQQGTAAPLPKSSLRSRKSSNEASPTRGPSLTSTGATVPSAAAIQRALSSASLPQLPPALSQDPSRASRTLKGASGTGSGDNSPHWPVSPRLKSPPPTETRSRSRRNSLRASYQKPEVPAPPSITVQSSSPVPSSRLPVQDEESVADVDELLMHTKGPLRGGSGLVPKLETVQEASLPTTPAFEGLAVGSSYTDSPAPRTSDDERNDVTSTKVTEDLSASAFKQSESGGEGHGNQKMHDSRSTSAHCPGVISPRASASSLSTVKSRTDVSTRNMTVETETVPSVAQATIGNQERSASGRVEGTLRLKPSNETIRPRKEKQKTKRKAPSIHAGTGRSTAHISYHHHCPSRPESWHSAAASSMGSSASYRSYDDRRPGSPPAQETQRSFLRPPPLLHSYSYSGTNVNPKASSKADVFEQKVASAVDEANSSDSDATFIYESNPPDPQPHRSRHHHSRTPSVTSITSLVDPRALRDGQKNMGKKVSMKFANPYTNQNADLGAIDNGDGTVRIGSGRMAAGVHHHIGRHGHGRGALNHMMIDSDSSLAQSSRNARGPSSRHPSQPNSPRFQQLNISHGNGSVFRGKHGEFSAYDVDMENAADDERTPLIPSMRSPRSRGSRQRNSVTTIILPERRYRSGGWFRKVAGCLAIAICVSVLVFTVLGLVFATTKPLHDVKIRAIQGVIASQEELMLDLLVEAVNPNIIAINVMDMEMNIFARSKHVGSDKWWREHGGKHQNMEEWNSIVDDLTVEEETPLVRASGTDEENDPIDEPGIGEPRTMLLGRIFHFDSPLSFDASFFNRRAIESLGQIHLPKPGNKTEAGGTERWEEVLQYPFDLIVKGVLKYQLPLSTQERKVAVSASFHYTPDDDKKKKLIAGEAKRSLPNPALDLVPKPLGRFARSLVHTLR